MLNSGKIFAMSEYAICEISGKQYKLIPGRPVSVDLLPESNIEVNVLLLAKDGVLAVGKPFLKEKLTLKRIEDTKGDKIRISKFHAKANYRRTTGYRSKITKVVWDLPAKKASVKSKKT